MSQRPSTLAGTWYSENEEVLRNHLESVDYNVDVDTTKSCRIGIVPHAGFIYSLKTACHVFKAIAISKPKKIILLGFSHSSMLSPKDKLHQTTYSSLKTPLGSLNCYTEKSLKSFIEPLDQSIDLREHCLEIQFPIIKYYFPKKIEVCPLLVPFSMEGDNEEIIEALYSLPESTAIIATTDFTHWGIRYDMIDTLNRYSFKDQLQFSQRIEEWDRKAMSLIEELDVENFRNFIHEENSTICGAETTIPLIIQVIKKLKLKLKWVHYAQSEILNDWDPYKSSVSYAAGVVYN